MSFDNLIDNAFDMLNKGGNAPMGETSGYSGLSIAYSLIAIAQELKRANDLELQKFAPPDELKKKVPKIDEDLGW